ncbi:hypothetical protein C1H46_035179 [Malus baccata]|uniref:Uncharacterized protein n=1 Tax=Malus baccata TaxID=106549 RepID=A0A540KYG3_MALBA|nr:hypothetical protein C1H46_035179 [Malus baccata]
MVKLAFSICFSNPPCLLRLADPRHRRSRLRPILFSPSSPFSRLRRLTPPFSVSGILTSSSSHARLWPSQLKPKRVSVLGKSTKKEEPVLEGLLKQYFNDFSFTFNHLGDYIALDYYFKLSFKSHNNNAQGGQSRASVATINNKDSSIASAQHGGGSDTPVASMLPGQLKLQPPRKAPELFQRLQLLREAPELFQRLQLLKNTHYTSEG